MAAELLPMPRRLHAAAVPSVYHTMARDSRPVRLLELPFGVRDGLSSIGDFIAASQFYQTVHGKPLIGGYLSRVEERTKASYGRHPVLGTLIELSEGRFPGDVRLREAAASADRLVSEGGIGYVIIDTVRASPALQRFAVDAFGLTRVAEGGGIVLYTPRGGP
jgi:hypothetical protein